MHRLTFDIKHTLSGSNLKLHLLFDINIVLTSANIQKVGTGSKIQQWMITLKIIMRSCRMSLEYYLSNNFYIL